MYITFPHRTTGPRKTPRMVMTRCSDILAPGSRYPLVDKNATPLGWCGLNGAFVNCKEDCRKSRQLVAVRTWIVYTCDQAYKG